MTDDLLGIERHQTQTSVGASAPASSLTSAGLGTGATQSDDAHSRYPAIASAATAKSALASAGFATRVTGITSGSLAVHAAPVTMSRVVRTRAAPESASLSGSRFGGSTSIFKPPTIVLRCAVCRALPAAGRRGAGALLAHQSATPPPAGASSLQAALSEIGGAGSRMPVRRRMQGSPVSLPIRHALLLHALAVGFSVPPSGSGRSRDGSELCGAWCAGINRHGERDARARRRRSSDPRRPGVMRRVREGAD
jgi:hypothetical protein